MAVIFALIGLFLGAAALAMGQSVGADAGFVFRLVGLPVLALVIFAALYLYHRRKSAELVVARYHLKGDALGWRRVTLGAGQQVRVCPCGALVPDFKAQEAHAEHHNEVAELRGELTTLLEALKLKRDEREPEPAWTAVVQPDPDEPEPAEQLEPAQARPDAGQLERAEREALELAEAERAEREQLEPDDIGEFESKARAFRASMEQHVKAGR